MGITVRRHSVIWSLSSTLLLAATLATFHQTARLAPAGELHNHSGGPEAHTTRSTITATMTPTTSTTTNNNLRKTSASDSNGQQVSARDQSATSSSPSTTSAAGLSSEPVPCSVTRAPVGENWEEFLKPSPSSQRSERAMNETERRAHESARCRSNNHRSRLLPVPVNQQRRKTLVAMQPGDSIDRWLFLSHEPHWMNECKVVQPGPILIQIPSFKLISLQSEVINQEPILHGNSVEVTRNRTQNVAPFIGLKRSRRSAPMLTHFGQSFHSNQVDKPQGAATSSVLFRTKHSSIRAKGAWPSETDKLQLAKPSSINRWLKPRKTTFNLSRWPKGQKFGFGSHSKSRFLTSDDFSGLAPLVSSPVDRSHQKAMNSSQVQAMFEKLHQLDYDINRKLSETYETEANLSDFIGKIYAGTESLLNGNRTSGHEAISEERKEQIRSDRSRWMPPLRELVLADQVNEPNLFNLTGGLYNGQVESIMANMTKYIELFLVAVEQMHYDHEELIENKSSLESQLILYDYKSLQAKTQQLLCDSKSLLEELARWKTIRRSFIESLTSMVNVGVELKLKESNRVDFFSRLITHTLHRDQPVPTDSFQYIESPLALAWARLDSSERDDRLRLLESYLPENKLQRDANATNDQHRTSTNGPTWRRLSYPTHFWRDVMPLEQRQLLSETERAVRDISILDEVRLFLKSYKSLIFNNVPVDGNLFKLYSG